MPDRPPRPEPIEPEELERLAAFLEEYALRPPRAQPHHPAADTRRWRDHQRRLRDLARHLRNPKAIFLEADAKFLDEQAERLYRMHTWINQSGPHTDVNRRNAAAALVAAGSMELVAGMVRARIERNLRP